jgi:MFS family permease
VFFITRGDSDVRDGALPDAGGRISRRCGAIQFRAMSPCDPARQTAAMSEAQEEGTAPWRRGPQEEHGVPAGRASGGYRALAGLLLGAALLIAGNGLFQTLIPLRLLQDGATTLIVGMVQSCYYLGFLLGAFLTRRLIDLIGQHRVFIGFAAAASILAHAFSAFESTLVLACVRFLTGITFMGLFVSIESWLNGTVPNAQRGRIFASYTTINYFALGSGQLLLNIDDPTGTIRFGLASALFAAAIIPVSLLEGWPSRVADPTLAPLPMQTWRDALMAAIRATPLTAPGCILAGFLYSGFYSMMPVFLARSGFATAKLSVFMSVCLLGALITQWPMGRLSDRMERPRLVLRVAILSAALSMALALFPGGAFLWCAAFIYVAVTFTQYGLIVSHVNDRAEPGLRVAVSSVLLSLFSIGGMTGPTIASLFMTALGSRGLFVFNALTCVGLAVAARGARSGAR